MSDNDQLAVLRRLQREIETSSEEHAGLAQGDAPADEVHDDSEGDSGSNDEPMTDDAVADLSQRPRLRQGLTAQFVAVLILTSIVLVMAGSLGMLSWLVSISIVLLLATTLIEGWHKVTTVGAVVVAAILLMSFIPRATESPEPEQTAVVTLPPQDPQPTISGSLGIYMDQVTDAWNTVDGGPRIIKGLTRHNESGEYDTFIYRFGEWGRLAGAYDPDDEAIYALLVAGQFSGEGTDQLYMHLCFMIAPYSQECVDSYFEHGLDGGTLDDFVDVAHEAEWTLNDHIWRLVIEGNVVTIRVFGEDAV